MIRFNPLMSGYGLEDPEKPGKINSGLVSILLCLDTGWKKPQSETGQSCGQGVFQSSYVWIRAGR